MLFCSFPAKWRWLRNHQQWFICLAANTSVVKAAYFSTLSCTSSRTVRYSVLMQYDTLNKCILFLIYFTYYAYHEHRMSHFFSCTRRCGAGFWGSLGRPPDVTVMRIGQNDPQYRILHLEVRDNLPPYEPPPTRPLGCLPGPWMALHWLAIPRQPAGTGKRDIKRRRCQPIHEASHRVLPCVAGTSVSQEGSTWLHGTTTTSIKYCH